MRALTLSELAAESGMDPALVERFVELGEIRPLADGRFDARDAAILTTVRALLGAGIALEDIQWAIEAGVFGIGVVGRLFADPTPYAGTYGELRATLGSAAERLGPVYGALGMPEPAADAPLRADEMALLAEFVGLWARIDPAGGADARIARIAADGLRRLAEGWLDLWDQHARPNARSQGAPAIAPDAGRPADPRDVDQNPTVQAAAVGRALVDWVFAR